ncbi:MAG: hypothetical protein KAT62_12440, partial [Desulfuromonadales bacterium]|nr:hypothetical protein [Desulfuromonadales bacterium]
TFCDAIKHNSGGIMETIKTASFEYLVNLAKEKPEGGYTFNLDGSIYEIEDVLEISKIAEKHGYIVIY